jgi:hypothetical protein
MEEDRRPAKERLLDMVQTEKAPNKRLKTTFSFFQPASLQNTLSETGWKKGDPNDETYPDYDMVWLIWVLRQLFPKDIVTHFFNLVGGMSFTVIREPKSFYAAGCDIYTTRLELSFWSRGNMTLYGAHRKIYFNLPIDKLKLDKNRTYVVYKEGKSYHYCV